MVRHREAFLAQRRHNDQQILFLAAARGAVSLLLEVPTGALGDRWGYKRTLGLGLVLLGWSSIQYVLGSHFINFLFATSLWTASEALASGTVQAYLYNLVSGQEGKARYRHYASRGRALTTWGVMLGSMVGGFIASFLPLWAAFVSSVLPVVAALVTLWLLPSAQTRGLAGAPGSRRGLLGHGLASVRYIVGDAVVRPILFLCVLVALPVLTFLELTQLEYIGIGLAVVLFGPIDFVRFGASMIGNIVGGTAFGRFFAKNGAIFGLGILAVLLWILFAWHSPWTALVVCVVSFVTSVIEVGADARLQHSLPSHMRAAATSGVSFVCNLVWCGLILVMAVFGRLHSIDPLIGVLAAIVTLGWGWRLLVTRKLSRVRAGV